MLRQSSGKVTCQISEHLLRWLDQLLTAILIAQFGFNPYTSRVVVPLDKAVYDD